MQTPLQKAVSLTGYFQKTVQPDRSALFFYNPNRSTAKKAEPMMV
jgi:hypothetical protein